VKTDQTALPDHPALPQIIAKLEKQLVALDRMGAHIGAAHLDAAIQHLRLEQTRRSSGKQ